MNAAFDVAASNFSAAGDDEINFAAGGGNVSRDGAPEREDAPERETETEKETDVAAALGRNLRRLRTRRGLSLERLARLSGVSRAMLGQIELGRSVPTILLLNKVARALEAPLTAFIAADGRSDVAVLRRENARVLVSHDGGYRARPLTPGDAERRVDFQEVRLRPGAVDHPALRPSGALKNLAVAHGALELEVGGEAVRLNDGDAASFDAGRPHVVRNIGAVDAVFYVVVTPQSGGE